MARQPRLTLAHQLHLVVQRGNNGQSIFVDDADRTFLIALLAEQASKFHVAVHAFVLLGDRFQLLMTPATEVDVPAMMQAVGRSYVRYFNDRHGRSGTLWDGRYRSTLVEADGYLLECMVFLDLSPVWEGLAAEPASYLWSSHRHYLGLQSHKFLTAPALLWVLGNTPFAREAAYAELVGKGLPEAKRERLSASAVRGWALGSAAFVEKLQGLTSRRVAPGKAGRPRKATSV
ncbi:MAG: transposase [Pseudomonadota bacterium]